MPWLNALRLKLTLVGALTAMLLSGCATTGAGTDTACLLFRPIYISKTDILSDGTARQILIHDEVGERVCGWERPGDK